MPLDKTDGQIGHPVPAPAGFSRFRNRVQVATTYRSQLDVSLGAGAITLDSTTATALPDFTATSSGDVTLGSESTTESGAFSDLANSLGVVPHEIEARSYGQIGRPGPAPAGFSRFWQQSRFAISRTAGVYASVGSGAITLGSTLVTMVNGVGNAVTGTISVAGTGSGSGFSQATITEVFPPTLSGTALRIAWTSSSPDGTWFQVYLDNHLQWFGAATQAEIPYPTEFVHITVGSVGPGQEAVDFSSAMQTILGDRVHLEWEGGTFEAIDIAGFHVYGSPAAGDDVNYTNILATIPAYPAGIILDGYGLGQYGDGGWGEAASYFNWTSGHLTSGIWTFGVKAFDQVGNESTTVEVSELIEVPPATMPFFPSTTSCLRYTYYNGEGMGPYGSGEYGGIHTFVLSWLPTTG